MNDDDVSDALARRVITLFDMEESLKAGAHLSTLDPFQRRILWHHSKDEVHKYLEAHLAAEDEGGHVATQHQQQEAQVLLQPDKEGTTTKALPKQHASSSSSSSSSSNQSPPEICLQSQPNKDGTESERLSAQHVSSSNHPLLQGDQELPNQPPLLESSQEPSGAAGVRSEVPSEVPSAGVPSGVVQSGAVPPEVPSEVSPEVPPGAPPEAVPPKEVPSGVPSEPPIEVPPEVPSEVPSEVLLQLRSAWWALSNDAVVRRAELRKHAANLLDIPARNMFFDFRRHISQQVYVPQLATSVNFVEFGKDLSALSSIEPELFSQVFEASFGFVSKYQLLHGFWIGAPDAMRLVKKDSGSVDSDSSSWAHIDSTTVSNSASAAGGDRGVAHGDSDSATKEAPGGGSQRPTFVASAEWVLEESERSRNSRYEMFIPGRGFLTAVALYAKAHSDDLERIRQHAQAKQLKMLQRR